MSIFQYIFFQHAILGSLLASIVCGLIGTYIVTRRLVFISGGITHASFGGIGIGVFFGINPILSAAIFSVLSAWGVQWFSHRSDMREDSAIAVFWTFGIAIGIIFSFLTPGFLADLSSFLFGNILTITEADLWLLTVLSAIVALLFIFMLQPIVAIAFDREYARSQKLPVEAIEYLMMTIIALTIVACLRMIGIVLVISLLTLPQMTANLFSNQFKHIMLLSIPIGFISCLGGLFISYQLNIPSGATIICVSILIYTLCKIFINIKARYFTTIVMLLSIFIIQSCSSSKNTAQTRFYKSFTAKYNTFYNGHEAFKDAVLEQEKGNKDNYMDILPYYIVSNKGTAELGKGNYDRAILKCEKTIRLHSIKTKPKVAADKRKTEKNRKWLAQKEYNPFLWKAWLLMGEAQFNKGCFIEAASTFSYMTRLYSANPDVLALARIWLARCYSELEWYYDSEDVLNNVKRDSLSWKLTSSNAGANGLLLLKQRKYKEAIPYIEKSLKDVHGTYKKARIYYLLGQLCHNTGDDVKAYKYFSNVIGTNPPYILEFNARIMQTEALGKGNSFKVLKKLRSMARNPKNKEYLDQVNYAIGNVYLAKGDTAAAMKAYEEGKEKSTRNGVEKGILMLKLGNLYWDKHKYKNAKECYTDVLGLIDKEHPEYNETNHRSTILDELVEHTESIELQDSLQRLAKMPEAERIAVIDKVIEEVKKKEEEERKAAEQAEMQAEHEAQMAELEEKTQTDAPTAPTATNKTENSWYFYNQSVVAQGKTAFQKKWGRRTLEDNWRRRNKSVLQSSDAAETNNELAQAADSTATDGKLKPGTAAKEETADSVPTDNKTREYYLAQIPLTPEKIIESNDILKDALYGAGVVYQDRLEDFDLATGSFNRLLNDFPKYNKEEEVYYRLYLMGLMKNDSEKSSKYQKLLTAEYPKGDYTKMANDPEYLYNAKYGKHIEDSLYTATYEAYRNGDFETVCNNTKISENKFPKGKNRPKFMFLEAMYKLKNNDQKGFVDELKTIAEKYSTDGISEIAGLMVKGVEEGRILQNTEMTGSLWSRRNKTEVEENTESGKIPEWNKSEDGNHLFILAYEKKKVNENQLLFEIAKYNFGKFMVRNFDLSFREDNGIGMLQVSPFINMKEAIRYSQQLMADKQMAQKLAGLRIVIISEENMKLLGEYYSFNDYQEYFENTYHNQMPKILKEADSIDTLNEPNYEVPEKKEEPADDENTGTDNNDFNPFNF